MPPDPSTLQIFPQPILDDGKRFLYEINIGDDKPVKVPVINCRYDCFLFHRCQVGITRAEVACTQLHAVKGVHPYIYALVKRRMEKTADLSLFFINKTEIFAVINGLTEFRLERELLSYFAIDL